jgi:hypothetical protein
MIKKLFLMMLLLMMMVIQPVFSSNEEWNQVNYKDENMSLYYKYQDGRGLYIKVNAECDVNYKIEMYDIFGRKIIDKTIEFSTDFNKSDIQKGIYCLRIHKQDTVVNSKIIVY